MKRSWKVLVAWVLCLVMAVGVVACKKEPAPEGLWAEATHQKDKEFGEGAKTVTVKVEAGDKSVTFTIHTDKETLGDALLDHKLIEGEDGDYGMYIKKVNGIQADYDKDGAYWAFSQNGEYMMTGVDGTSIAGGETYELVYTKG